MATKIYIAGKITGDPDYKAKFEEAENFYKKRATPYSHQPGCPSVCSLLIICVSALQ